MDKIAWAHTTVFIVFKCVTKGTIKNSLLQW
jgi:hypothetical protein